MELRLNVTPEQLVQISGNAKTDEEMVSHLVEATRAKAGAFTPEQFIDITTLAGYISKNLKQRPAHEISNDFLMTRTIDQMIKTGVVFYSEAASLKEVAKFVGSWLAAIDVLRVSEKEPFEGELFYRTNPRALHNDSFNGLDNIFPTSFYR